MPLQNMPLWHKDYFYLKAIKNQQEEFCALALRAWKGINEDEESTPR